MNLLTDAWIPIQTAGMQRKISLQQLLCSETNGDICLPRDDMEFACLQLIVAITQVLFTPKDKKELITNIKNPLDEQVYIEACESKKDWFDLDHAKTPFMQYRGVKAKEATKMEKLLAGVADGTNKVFVNPQGLADGLCASCAAIALYNSAYNCPSSGGGFKSGMRGSTPIGVLIQGKSLREMIWHNVLMQESIESVMPWYKKTKEQTPSYVDPIKAGAKLNINQVGVNRGLLWQPAHVELCCEKEHGHCSLCGNEEKVYQGFNKEKFSFNLEGVWPHPLSSQLTTIQKNKKKESFISFNSVAPGWTYLTNFIKEENNKNKKITPPPVITQLKTMGAKNLKLLVGGYRNSQATVLERRHQMLSLACGWQNNSHIVSQIIKCAEDYKTSGLVTLFLFIGKVANQPQLKKGERRENISAKVYAESAQEDWQRLTGALAYKKGKKQSIELVAESFEKSFYQQTESLMYDCFASIDFLNPTKKLIMLRAELKQVVKDLFNQAVLPYQQEPKELKALATSRRLLNKYLKELEPKGELDANK